MSFDLPDSDTVYITGLPPNTTEETLATYFGSIGVIKLDRKTKGKKVIVLIIMLMAIRATDHSSSCRFGSTETRPRALSKEMGLFPMRIHSLLHLPLSGSTKRNGMGTCSRSLSRRRSRWILPRMGGLEVEVQEGAMVEGGEEAMVEEEALTEGEEGEEEAPLLEEEGLAIGLALNAVTTALRPNPNATAAALPSLLEQEEEEEEGGLLLPLRQAHPVEWPQVTGLAPRVAMPTGPRGTHAISAQPQSLVEGQRQSVRGWVEASRSSTRPSERRRGGGGGSMKRRTSMTTLDDSRSLTEEEVVVVVEEEVEGAIMATMIVAGEGEEEEGEDMVGGIGRGVHQEIGGMIVVIKSGKSNQIKSNS